MRVMNQKRAGGPPIYDKDTCQIAHIYHKNTTAATEPHVRAKVVALGEPQNCVVGETSGGD